MDKGFWETEIYDLLCRLGVTANYTGFFHTAYAISLCIQRPDRLLLVTKWLYPEVAKQYDTNWKAVERNIRTVNCIIWRESRPLLEELAHRRLEQKPRNAQMLAILVSSLDTGPLVAHKVSETAYLTGGATGLSAGEKPSWTDGSGQDCGERRRPLWP